MDEKKLTQIANQSPTASEVFKVFKERIKNPRGGIMDTRRVRYELEDKGVTVVPQDFIETFKGLEKAGVGKLIAEKGGWYSFKWTANMKEVVAKAFIHENYASHSEVIKTETQVGPGVLMLLPSGREVQFALPGDLTKEDAQALCKMIMRRAR